MTGRRRPGHCAHAPPNPSTPRSASATSTCASPTSTARSPSTATRLGFGVTADGRAIGLDAAFLAAGDYHHHIGLNTWESAGGTPPPPGHTGLYHVAFLYPDRHELGRAVSRLLDHGYRSTTPPTTAAPSPSTSTTPTATASSSTTTARAQTGSTPTGNPILKADRIDYRDLICNPRPQEPDPMYAQLIEGGTTPRAPRRDGSDRHRRDDPRPRRRARLRRRAQSRRPRQRRRDDDRPLGVRQPRPPPAAASTARRS